MTNIDQPHVRRNAHRAALGAARRPSAQLISDGVVASYIHDISRRHRGQRPAGRGVALTRARSADAMSRVHGSALVQSRAE